MMCKSSDECHGRSTYVTSIVDSVVRTFWVKNNVRGVVLALAKMSNHSVLVDVLSACMDKSEIFTLEICALLLPLLKDLLTSQYDRYLTVALSVISLLLKSFGSIIQETRLAARPAPGVDLSGEQRLDRCNKCYEGFVSVREILEPLVRRGGDAAQAASELHMALSEVR
ncbi:hypothetical protein CBR_g12770 [Chara braunii]|uniref:Katanin p80 subunit C-terminal domain-containing protein n=1 Tax=Chara braunii TaxID=69332 RepID=A0A388KSZ0_CHABU|nr:hypothetical protein CBR_g12770 [Chara braunii]|eukprot:GBG73053.1 hypothetical protein CBR_g12770 [Chara braunii]